MGEAKGSILKFGEYPSVFWTVITLELLERGAYYGIMGYFPVHCMANLGFSGTKFGILYALLVFLLYFMPLISSSLARKYGYRTILLAAFITLAPTYYILTFVKGYYSFIPLIIAWGLGAGAFKPMISATIAHVTEKKKRNSAYSIYYLSINWGSLLSMVSIGLLIPEHFAQIAFAVGGVLISANLLITIFLYRNPVEKEPEERIGDAFRKMGKVLKDKKFTILLLIYAGFFVIFSSMHTFLPAFYTEFGLKPYPWLEAPLMSAINPLTIVMLGPFLSKYMDRFDSLKLMITGMLLFCGGLFLLGMIPLWYALGIGIFIFSIGEFLTHPNFISYVSKIAPEDKVALYMGYAFLPSAAGQVFGSLAGGVLWDKIAVARDKPSLFWAIYVVVGLISIGNFLIYNRWINSKKGIVTKKRSLFSSGWSNAGIYCIVILVLFAGFSAGTTEYIGDDDETVIHVFSVDDYDTMSGFSDEIKGTLQGGGSETTTIPIQLEEGQLLRSVTFELTWRDEADPNALLENKPDEFSLSVMGESGEHVDSDSGSNPQGGEGKITVTFDFEHDAADSLNGTGNWEVEIRLENCGDSEGRLAIWTQEDNSNEYALGVSTEIYVPAG